MVLVTIGFLGCGFLLYVLFQWTRETKRRPASRSAFGDESGEAGPEEATISRPYAEGGRRKWSAQPQIARGPEHVEAIERVPSRLQSLRTDRVRENCKITELGKKGLGERNDLVRKEARTSFDFSGCSLV